MVINFSRSALNDLESIKSFYLEEGIPEVGNSFLVAIFDHVEMLKDHSKAGRIVPEFNEEHIRELIHAPFRIVYLYEEKLIHIIRVWRSERILILTDS
jgi:toxin ParE1/3/4